MLKVVVVACVLRVVMVACVMRMKGEACVSEALMVATAVLSADVVDAACGQ